MAEHEVRIITDGSDTSDKIAKAISSEFPDDGFMISEKYVSMTFLEAAEGGVDLDRFFNAIIGAGYSPAGSSTDILADDKRKTTIQLREERSTTPPRPDKSFIRARSPGLG